MNPEEWYQSAIQPGFQRVNDVKRMEMNHYAQQTPYQQFQSQYPAIDQYARDVVSGRRFAKTIHDTGTLMSQAMDSPEALNEAVGLFGVGGIIAGKMAKTANLEMLDIAKGATKKGMSRQKVFDATGWYKGVDDKWKFEVPDKDMTINNYTGTGGGITVNNPSLRENYPRINRGVNIKQYDQLDGTAFYKRPDKFEYGMGRRGEIGIPRNEIPPKDVFAHEYQHAIQADEGFAKGGTVSKMVDKSSDLKMLSDAKVLKKMDGDKDMFKLVFEREPELGAESIVLSGESYKSISKRVDDLYNNVTPYAQYNNLAGEVEARNVSTRLGMMADDRRMLAPWLTEDVPQARQLVRFK